METWARSEIQASQRSGTEGHSEEIVRVGLEERSDRLFAEALSESRGCLHRLILRIIPLQFGVLLAYAAYHSPLEWSGAAPGLHLHLVLTLCGAFLTTLLYASPAMRNADRPLTRWATTVLQMLIVSLWTHVTGGRIEAHFGYFILLSMLAAYRDLGAILAGVLCVVADHTLRGIYFPESVFGIFATEATRGLEHGVYLIAHALILRSAISWSLQQIRRGCHDQAVIEASEHHLEQQVQERTKALTRALDDASAGLRARSEFLSSVTHELRTPLHGIISMSAESLRSEHAPQSREALEISHSAAVDLLGLVDNILEFSRPVDEHLCPARMAFALREKVSDLLVRLCLEHSATAREIRFVCAPEITEWRYGPAFSLRRLLRTLLDNAIRHAAPAAIEIIIEPGSQQDRLRFWVKDSGNGLPPATEEALRQHLLDLQGESSRSRFGLGLGLGLVVAPRLVARMGGRFEFTSSSESGTAFSFEIELPTEETRRPPPELPKLALYGLSEARGATIASLAESYGARVRRYENEASIPNDPRTRVITGVPALANSWSNAVLVYTRTNSSERGVPGRLPFPMRPCDFLAALGNSVAGIDESLPAAKRESVQNQGSDDRHSVLIVDDNAVNRRIAQRSFERLGWNVKCAMGGRQSIDIVGQEDFDLILMDMRMPEMDGCEATRKIREFEALEGRARHFICAFTANDSEPDRLACFEAGMDEYLTKPLDSMRLEHICERALATKAAQ